MSAPKHIAELASSSGNNFHTRVVRAFRDSGWQTLISPYYLDVATNRAREIDLIAERSWDVPGSPREPLRQLSIKLLVECKYTMQDTVFWFDARDSTATTKWLQANTPLPGPNNLYTQKHHYFASGNAVAKLFCSQADRETEREAIYKALNQSLHAMVYLRGKGSILPNDNGPEVRTIVELPVIVVNSFEKFFQVDMSGSGGLEPISENFQLEVNYAYLDAKKSIRSEYFLIDVVALDKLEEFLHALDADANAMFQFL